MQTEPKPSVEETSLYVNAPFWVVALVTLNKVLTAARSGGQVRRGGAGGGFSTSTDHSHPTVVGSITNKCVSVKLI